MRSKWDQLKQNNAQNMQTMQQLAGEHHDLTTHLVNLTATQQAIANKYQHDFDGLEALLKNQVDLGQVAYQLGDMAGNVDEFIAKYETEFSAATKLTKKDFWFLLTATALQVVRQYVMSKKNEYLANDRETDQAAANTSHGGKKEVKDRSLRGDKDYYSSADEIRNNPVPFDTQLGSGNFNILFGDSKGLGGGHGHRFRTLGHDSILGWIFGTANICTRTVTLSNFVESYHVKYGRFVTSDNILSGRPGDYFEKPANTWKVIQFGLIEPAAHLTDGRLAVSVIKEGQHLLSDVNSRESLGLPGLQAIDANLAQELAESGINLHNLARVGKQATIAIGINTLIAMIHRLLYNPAIDHDLKLYEVRTRKIISYSNLIASASNVLYVAIAASMGDADAINSLDIGGLLVTIVTVLRNNKVQRDIYEEFMANRWYADVMAI